MSPVVLNTRPREQAATLSRLLRQADFQVVEAPAIDIVTAWHPSELALAQQELAAGAFDWVVLPSVNAGRALRATLQTLSAAAPRTRLVCGASTAQALSLAPAFALARFSAAAALELMRPLVRLGERVLVPRAAEGRNELLDGLRALGATLSAPVAYRTLFVDDAALRLQAGGVDVITLCSPSSVASLLRAADVLLGEGVAVVCLGDTTALAARSAGLQVSAIARGTNMAALVEAVSSLAVPETVV